MIFPTDPLERVRSGMEVVDDAGNRLGRVARVQLPVQQVTHPPDSDLIDDMARNVPAPPEMTDVSLFEVVGPSPVGHDPANLPELPEPLRAHLRRVGFIEIDAPHLRAADRFVAADHIHEVTESRIVVRRPTS